MRLYYILYIEAIKNWFN